MWRLYERLRCVINNTNVALKQANYTEYIQNEINKRRVLPVPEANTNPCSSTTINGTGSKGLRPCMCK